MREIVGGELTQLAPVDWVADDAERVGRWDCEARQETDVRC